MDFYLLCRIVQPSNSGVPQKDKSSFDVLRRFPRISHPIDFVGWDNCAHLADMPPCQVTRIASMRRAQALAAAG